MTRDWAILFLRVRSIIRGPPARLVSSCPSWKFTISRPHFCSPMYPHYGTNRVGSQWIFAQQMNVFILRGHPDALSTCHSAKLIRFLLWGQMIYMLVTGQHYHRGLLVSGSGSPRSGLVRNNTTALDWCCLTSLRTLRGLTFQNGFLPHSFSIYGALMESIDKQLMLIPGALRTGQPVTNPTWKLDEEAVMDMRWAHVLIYSLIISAKRGT